MLRTLRTLTATALLALSLSSSTHTALAHEHHHEEEAHVTVTASPFEASAIYDLAVDAYALTLCAASHDVVEEDGGMIFALLALASSSDSDVRTAASRADAIFNAFASDEVVHERVVNGTTLRVKTNATAPDVLYRAAFATEGACVNAALPVASAGAFMLFTQHGADEVNVVVTGANAQPIAATTCVTGCGEDDGHAHDEHGEHAGADSDKPSDSWLGPIAASLVISLTSFVGVFVLGLSKRRADAAVEYMTSFAAGCLLGVVVFHLYPEGTAYLGDAGEWVMGVWVLGGIAFSMAVESGVHMALAAFGVDHDHHDHGEHAHAHDVHSVDSRQSLHSNSNSHTTHNTGGDAAEKGRAYVAHPSTPTATTTDASTQTFYALYVRSLRFVEPVAWITAVGDFFHAFTDGVVLAVAFKSCSASLGWAVAFGVVLHEVPHRVGDFFIYLKAGMRVSQALVVNFVASLASLLGAVILLAAGSVSDHALGYLMGFGCGALLFIGLGVLLPPMLAVRDRRRASLHFFWFALGCVLIGLSVLQHTHCESSATSGEDAHAHNH